MCCLKSLGAPGGGESWGLLGMEPDPSLFLTEVLYMCVCVYICVHAGAYVYVYIFIHMYIKVAKERN